MIFSVSSFSQEPKFYVYKYIRSKNSKNGLIGTPYYIGKGVRDRAYSKYHKIAVPADKSNIIIIQDKMLEVEALQLEMLLIYLYGRYDLKSGCLHNRTNGGESNSGSGNPMFGKKHSGIVRENSKKRRSRTNSIRKWYNNGTDTKFLPTCPIGWRRGRLNQKPSTKGCKWYNNGSIQLSTKEKPIGDNWINGMLPKRILGRD